MLQSIKYTFSYMNMEMFGLLIGGIGLFILGMDLMSEGLKQSSGVTLTKLIKKTTDTKLKGFLSGFLATTLLQSSTATTLLAIGFVNAGILSFSYSLWLLFGANVGTTMTGWLVALIGLKIKISSFALPIIGFAVGAKVIGKGKRWGSIADIFAGFGILFLGLDYLQSSFSGIGGDIDLSLISDMGIWTVPFFILVGFVLTIIMQSSSASIAIIITFASSTGFGLMPAAAGVIGANIGTTITALIATFGATANAKRSALAHIIFNIVAGIFALLTLKFFVDYVGGIYKYLPLERNIANDLALFHTFINVSGAIIMIPLSDTIATFLSKRFSDQNDSHYKSKYLDKNLLGAPGLAVESLEKEYEVFAKSVYNYTTNKYNGLEFDLSLEDLRIRLDIIDEYVAEIIPLNLTKNTAKNLNEIIESINILREIIINLSSIEEYTASGKILENKKANEKLEGFLTYSAKKIIKSSAVNSKKKRNNIMKGYLDTYKSTRQYFFKALSENKLSPKQYEKILRILRDTRTVTGYFMKNKEEEEDFLYD